MRRRTSEAQKILVVHRDRDPAAQVVLPSLAAAVRRAVHREQRGDGIPRAAVHTNGSTQRRVLVGGPMLPHSNVGRGREIRESATPRGESGDTIEESGDTIK